MKLWLLETDDYGYDKYNAAVIRAETAEDALAIGQRKCKLPKDATVTALDHDGERGIVLSSFNAG